MTTNKYTTQLIGVLCLAASLLIVVGTAASPVERSSILVIHEGQESGANSELAQELQIVFDQHAVTHSERNTLDPDGDWSSYDQVRVMQKLYAIAILRDSAAVIGILKESDNPESEDVLVYLVVVGTNSAVGRIEKYTLSNIAAPDIALTIKELVDQGTSHLAQQASSPDTSETSLPAGWQSLEMPEEFQTEETTKPPLITTDSTSPPEYNCSFGLFGHGRAGIAAQEGPSIWFGGGFDFSCDLHQYVVLYLGAGFSKGVYSFTGDDAQNAMMIEPRVGLGVPFNFSHSRIDLGFRMVPGISRYALSYEDLQEETFWKFALRAELGGRFSLNTGPRFALFTDINFGFNLLRENFREDQTQEVLLRTPVVDITLALGVSWRFGPKG